MQILDSAGNLLAWWVPVKDGRGTQLRQLSRNRPPHPEGRATAKSLEVLVDNDIYNVTGGYLTRADAGHRPTRASRA